MPPFAIPRLPAPTASRLTVYALGSTTLAALVVLRACATRTTGFAVGVGLAKSNGSLMVLGNLAVCFSLLVGMGLQRIFFGRLRPIEVEHLYDKAWYFLTESLLAFTMFREDFNLSFLALFGALLALKCFHWIAADRIDYLDQLASPPRWTFHLRLCSLLSTVLLPLDCLLLALTAKSLLERGISGRIIFVSEFAVLLVSLAGVSGRYAVWAWDQWRLVVGRRARRAERARRVAADANEGAGEPGQVVDEEEDDEDGEEDVWEGKSMVLFYLDLTTDFLKLIVYLLFFILVLTNYGLPFNILRDLYLTSRSFMSRLRSLIQYRAATRDMESRYADATAAEIGEQGVCIICREEMRPGEDGGKRAKRLGCGHAFHLRCLRMWLERQQSCPTCRRTVLGNPPAAAAVQQPAAPPAPGATPLAGGGNGQPQHVPHDRPLPPNLVRLGDHLAQHPPAPLNVHGQHHAAPTAPLPNGAAAAPAAGIFGAPNPPQRFAHLFTPAGQAAPPPPQARGAAGAGHVDHPIQPRRAGAGFDLNAFGLELDFRIQLGGGPPPALAPRAPLVAVPHAPQPVPTPTVPAERNPHPTSTTSSTAAATSPESDRVRRLRELSAAMTPEESAAFTKVLSKIIQDASRTEIGDELAHARRFDVREALGRIVAALHDRPNDIAPAAALFPLVLGNADISLAPLPTGGLQARLVDADGEWSIDLSSRSALWIQPAPTSAAKPESKQDDDDDAIDEERMTPREVAARAALRRSARLNPTPPPFVSSASPVAPTSTASTAAAGPSTGKVFQPQPTRIVELDDNSVLFTVPPPSDASPSRSASAASAVASMSASILPNLADHVSSTRPRVTLTPLQPPANPTPLQQLVGSHSAQPLPSLPLPPNLTQEVLDQLALQTREAIEQRLAYIAYVDGALSSLRAELSRVQQAVSHPLAMPSAPSAQTPRDTSEELRALEELMRRATEPPAAEAALARVDSKGKGRATDVEPKDVPLPADPDDNDDNV